jgi:membrane-bound ClpP family serine protease
MDYMEKFLGIVTLIGLLVFLVGFISLFNEGLGFSGLMPAETWESFQMVTIIGGILLTIMAGTISYIFYRKK